MRPGQIYEVEFWDHAAHSGPNTGPILCRAYGMIIYVDNQYIALANWICKDDVDSTNEESVSILKSTIKAKRRLK